MNLWIDGVLYELDGKVKPVVNSRAHWNDEKVEYQEQTKVKIIGTEENEKLETILEHYMGCSMSMELEVDSDSLHMWFEDLMVMSLEGSGE
jgi:hypothetical protein